MMQPLILNLAPTGMVPTRTMTPHVPLAPAEIAEQVVACVERGVSMVHLHARDAEGAPAWDRDSYAQAICRIRAHAPEAVVVVSTSGRNFPAFEQRADVLALSGDVKPDMASLTLGSLNFISTASVNSPEMIVRLAARMAENGIRPELEIFDLGMVNVAHDLIRRDLIRPPYFFNVLLGNLPTAQAKLSHLGLIVSELPAGSVWSLAGLGRFQTSMSLVGVAMADGVRIGIEDNIWFDEARTELATNLQLVDRVARIAQAAGRPLASSAQVRARLGLERRGAAA